MHGTRITLLIELSYFHILNHSLFTYGYTSNMAGVVLCSVQLRHCTSLYIMINDSV